MDAFLNTRIEVTISHMIEDRITLDKLERSRTTGSTRSNKIILRVGGYGGEATQGGGIPKNEF